MGTDAERFAVPPAPVSTASQSRAPYAESLAPSDVTDATPGSGRSSSKVEDPLYRDANLAANNIYLRSSREPFPKHIAGLVEYVCGDRDSPGPSPDEVWQHKALEELGMSAAETKVERYFQRYIFPDCDPGDILDRSDRLPMSKHVVPTTGSQLKVSNPLLDMLYGYSRNAFTRPQQAQFNSMGNAMVANSQNLIYVLCDRVQR